MKILLLVVNPGLLLPELANISVVKSEQTVLITNPKDVPAHRQGCSDVMAFYLSDSSLSVSATYRKARETFEEAGCLGGHSECYVLEPWVHGSDEAIENEVLLIERLQDVLPEVADGSNLLKKLHAKQLSILTAAK